MANMSYCRFQNTSSALADCIYALEELLNDPSAEPLSDNESDAAETMVHLCTTYLKLHAQLRGE